MALINKTTTARERDAIWHSEEEATLAAVTARAGLRRGAAWPAQSLVLALTMSVVAALGLVVGDLVSWATHRGVLLVTLAGIGCWRWSWFLIQNGRAILYRYVVYPRIRRHAEKAVAINGPAPEVVVMATTYHEKPWITRLVFDSIFSELSAVSGLTRRPRVVVATGCDEDDANIQAVYAERCGTLADSKQAYWPPELVLLREGGGKRSAIAAALREIVKGNPHPAGAVVFLDGDTILRTGFFQRVLPLFRLEPQVAAVTTNEDGYAKGPSWFAEWISLRFGLRHRTMCSVALSNKLLCLTGRLSVFRGSVAADPTFLAQIERDVINHWLWGSFEMLSGDDKSTWFWLSRHGCRMLYVPDAMVTTIEVVQGSALKRALANIRRWSGNSLRHNWRAMRLGPSKLGWFPWWSLIDQRFAMFTVLFGPMMFLTALFNGQLILAAGLALWLLLSRLAQSSIAWWHGRRWSAFYLPLVLLSDWTAALTKIWILFHPAKQAWLNRGARTLDSTRKSRNYGLQAGLAHYLYCFTCAVAVIVVCLVTGSLPILREARLFLSAATEASPSGSTVGKAVEEEGGMEVKTTTRFPIFGEPGPETRKLSEPKKIEAAKPANG
jgi:mannuronan synthase